MTSVTVEEGKYTFRTQATDYRIHVLRYNEPWLIIEKGSNAIAALMNELIEARGKSE